MLTQKPENHHDGVPVSQAILQKQLFLPAIPKKKTFWPKHTTLSRFCQNKVISQSVGLSEILYFNPYCCVLAKISPL